MKLILLSILIFFTLTSNAYAQDTFSIVAADSVTREVGSAGASCVDLFVASISDPSFLGELLPDTGAINTQSYYLSTNQNNARIRMRAGDTPAQIISWLAANDAGADSSTRQYGIVGFSGNNLNAVGYTGANCMNYKSHKTGSINGIHYAIQGNILLGQQVIDSMESKFRNAQGNLACRLMAALQGAKMIGADTRCTGNGSSSLFAFIKVSQPTDTYGNSSLKLSVRTHDGDQIEPIDSLKKIFDQQNTCGTVSGLNQVRINNKLHVYPNPSKDKIFITLKDFTPMSYLVVDQYGREILKGQLTKENPSVEVQQLTNGLYFIKIGHLNWQLFFKN